MLDFYHFLHLAKFIDFPYIFGEEGDIFLQALTMTYVGSSFINLFNCPPHREYWVLTVNICGFEFFL